MAFAGAPPVAFFAGRLIEATRDVRTCGELKKVLQDEMRKQDPSVAFTAYYGADPRVTGTYRASERRDPREVYTAAGVQLLDGDVRLLRPHVSKPAVTVYLGCPVADPTSTLTPRVRQQAVMTVVHEYTHHLQALRRPIGFGFRNVKSAGTREYYNQPHEIQAFASERAAVDLFPETVPEIASYVMPKLTPKNQKKYRQQRGRFAVQARAELARRARKGKKR